MDPEAPVNVLEVTARALTYYLDVSVDCTRRIVAVDGALKAIIERLKEIDIESRVSKDLAEQCVKVCFCIQGRYKCIRPVLCCVSNSLCTRTLHFKQLQVSSCTC